jgi:adenylate cyclase
MVSGTDASDPTGQSADRRKLIVVVHADVVGYSRLIGLDDVGTLDRMRKLRREVIDPAIAAHGGRIVNTSGDGLLVVFDSVDGAVRSALRVQEQVPVVDGEAPTDRAIRFRIGINVGDVIPDGTDVHGDVVNVASRLQAECSPGGICVSRAVRDHLHDRLDIAFEPLGSLNLKNIAHPVEAFMLRAATTTAGTLPSVERSLVHGAETLPLPDKPSIAVLPFANLSADPEQEYFSEGVADDIITELSRSRSLFVIARNSSFTYKGRSVDIKQVSRELGVRYVLEGSVRRNRDRVRVVAQLIDAETSNHIWAERYDRALEDVFAVQDEITASVVTAIVPAVAEAELRRVLRKPPESLGAWEAYQRGMWHVGRASLADSERAKAFFLHSISLDAAFVPAYTALANLFLDDAATYGAREWDEELREAADWARQAIALDHDDPEAQAALGACLFLAGNRDEGREHISIAVAIYPNSSAANFQKGGSLISDGRPSEGRVFIMKAMRLDPRNPHSAKYMSLLAASYYFERDYEMTVDVAKRSMAHYPDYPRAYRWLAAAFGQLGRTAEARAALNELMRVSSAALGVYVRSRRLFLQEDYEHLLDGLRKAGWQGDPPFGD